jgi:hypothetical protein
VERFQAELRAAREVEASASDTWSDARRQMQLEEYLSLFLFGLFNPVVKSLRGLCAASRFERVQEEICERPVSLGSFSEAQAVVELELLERVFAQLFAQTPAEPGAAPAVVIDSTVWPVLPRMSWAFGRRQNGLGNAVRLHVEFDLERGSVRRAEVTPAKTCERAQWKKWAQPGNCYIGDRYYAYDYGLLAKLQEQGVDFVVRLRRDAQWVEEKALELTPKDRAAQVVWASVVRLGKAGDGPRVLLVQVLGEDDSLFLASTLPANVASPELLALLYRHRWQVELFFRWLKCILGCRAWLAESPRGVALQCYLALIAAQLLLLYTGRRPGKRQMEAIQFYLMGWCSVEELVARAERASAKKN